LKGSEMKLSNVMFLSAIVLGTATANPALAQFPSVQELTPPITGVVVTCTTQPTTEGMVKVNFNVMVAGLVYEFRNVSTGQTITANSSPSPLGEFVSLPPGTYDLTVKHPNNLHSRSLWVNIVVPVAVSTNGQGTGCRFLGPGERPAVPTPLKR
jgi:hypothetical protein